MPNPEPPAGHAAFTRSHVHGVNMVVLARVARLLGVDQLHVGTAVGKMAETEEEVRANIAACKEPMHGVRPVLPVASGGLHPGTVPRLVEIFGVDTVIQAGGGIHGHPKGTRAGAKAMLQSIEAAMKGVPAPEYAKKHKELAEALKIWKYRPPNTVKKLLEQEKKRAKTLRKRALSKGLGEIEKYW